MAGTPILASKHLIDIFQILKYKTATPG